MLAEVQRLIKDCQHGFKRSPE